MVFGGAFDPPHNGHLAALRAALAVGRDKNYDEVLIIPTGMAPHKSSIASPAHRLAMARILARLCEDERVRVCEIEINKTSKSYTIDTLRELKKRGDITFIIGADEAANFHNWYMSEELLSAAAFAVVPRPGFSAVLSERFTVLEMERRAASSTSIRAKIAMGESACDDAPTEILQYIYENDLYGWNVYRKAIIKRLEKTLKPSRLKHTLGVEAEAVSLSYHYRTDPFMASIAALLHDCAKYISDAKMLALCGENDIAIDKWIAKRPNLAHSFVGAVIARSDYGVTDESVLAAIANHTFGKPGMDTLSQIICVADYFEPNRYKDGDKHYLASMDEVKRRAYINLPAAVCAYLKSAVGYAGGKAAHPLSFETIAYFNL